MNNFFLATAPSRRQIDCIGLSPPAGEIAGRVSYQCLGVKRAELVGQLFGKPARATDQHVVVCVLARSPCSLPSSSLHLTRTSDLLAAFDRRVCFGFVVMPTSLG